MFTCYAHSHPDQPEPGDKWQRLAEHLRGVSNLAGQFAAEMFGQTEELTDELRELQRLSVGAARTLGLLHDLGKYRDEFQQYLRKQRAGGSDTHHAIYGAAAACELQATAAVFAVAGHHAGLHDASVLQTLLMGNRYPLQQVARLIKRAGVELPDEFRAWPRLIPPEQIDPDDHDTCRRHELWTRMLFSVLVDADRLETERARTGKPRRTVPFDASLLLRRLREARDAKRRNAPDNELNRLRNDIFDACLRAGSDQPQGFFSLTAPTGAAKTLSLIAFSLAHAQRHKLRRVIVVIPYLSIIEQNAAEYVGIFGRDQLVEHHSAVDSDAPRGAESAERTSAELATENWDAPIIITTSVQFLESLLAGSPAKCRKLHNVARSVVVFDEMQTLPTHLLSPVFSVLRELVARYRVSTLFCSATLPAFQRFSRLPDGFGPDECVELAPDRDRIFNKLRRVRYRLPPAGESLAWSDLAERIADYRQVLCVVNTRRDAHALWQEVQSLLGISSDAHLSYDRVFHLSSAMCAQHRLDIFGDAQVPAPGTIRDRLGSGLPCRVVSTQLIEAGVDVDFPVVFRAFGPLDAIVQVAGRCNREGQLRDGHGNPSLGQVVVFRPAEGALPRGVYRTATETAAILLAQIDSGRLGTDPQVFHRYFDELYQLVPTDHERRGEATIQEDRAAMNFARVAERSRVIRDDTTSLIVPYGQAARWIERIRLRRQFDWQELRRLQRYMVSVHECDLAKLNQFGLVTPLLPEYAEIPVVDPVSYHKELGLLIQERPVEDLIV